MTKLEAQNLQRTYGMEILRNPITGEAWGLYVDADAAIPELEALAATNLGQHIAMEAKRHGYDQGVLYRLALPTDWFNLGGWA